MNIFENGPFEVRLGDGRKVEITESKMRAVKRWLHAPDDVRSRIGYLLWLDALVLLEARGLNPGNILREVEALENLRAPTGTKPETQFVRPPLEGLWHKHFFSAHFMPKNILNAWGRGNIEKLAKGLLDDIEASGLTEEKIANWSRLVVHGSLEDRRSNNSLTGEWIVFTRHKGHNYYLCLGGHSVGDQHIYDRITEHCRREFPFLFTSRPAD